MTLTVFEGEQRTPEWYALRVGIPTASCFHHVMAKGRGSAPSVTRGNYVVDVALEILTGEPQESDYSNRHMERGQEHEPLALMRYELLSQVMLREVCFIRHQELAAGCSPDALVDDDGMVEVKCPIPRIHAEYLLLDTVPSAYWWQVQGQLLITGRAWCDFVSFNASFPEPLQLHIIRARPDPDARAQLLAGLKAFHADVAGMVGYLRELADSRTVKPKARGRKAAALAA